MKEAMIGDRGNEGPSSLRGSLVAMYPIPITITKIILVKKVCTIYEYNLIHPYTLNIQFIIA